MKSLTKIIIVSIIFGSVSGTLATNIVINFQSRNQNDLIEDFYLTENAVHVSPHSIRKSMDKGDNSFILVDLRSQEEYEREHIISAVSIPAYKDPDTSAYGDVERIFNAFKDLKSNDPDKDIIVYCYSMPCMTGRKVGQMLAKNGIYVKHLEIGWNEWRYFWNLWNHEHEWNATNVEDYIWSGKEAGIPKFKTGSLSCSVGELGC